MRIRIVQLQFRLDMKFVIVKLFNKTLNRREELNLIFCSCKINKFYIPSPLRLLKLIISYYKI